MSRFNSVFLLVTLVTLKIEKCRLMGRFNSEKRSGTGGTSHRFPKNFYTIQLFVCRLQSARYFLVLYFLPVTPVTPVTVEKHSLLSRFNTIFEI